MPVAHDGRVVAVARPVEVGVRPFDAAGADDHQRFVPEVVERDVAAGRVPRGLEIHDHRVPSRLISHSTLEFIERIDGAAEGVARSRLPHRPAWILSEVLPAGDNACVILALA